MVEISYVEVVKNDLIEYGSLHLSTTLSARAHMDFPFILFAFQVNSDKEN